MKDNPISTKECPTVEKRPLNAKLSKVNIYKAGILPHWEDALDRFFNEID